MKMLLIAAILSKSGHYNDSIRYILQNILPVEFSAFLFDD